MEPRAKSFGRPIQSNALLSFSGAVQALGMGWPGGELVDRLAVGVGDGAHLDAPSSLRVRRIKA